MLITFLKSNDDPRVVNKTMFNAGSGGAALTASVHNLSESINLLSPVFVVASNTEYLNATHVYAAELRNRYYYINNIALMTGGKMEIQCSIDLLKTYETQLMFCPATAIRSQSAGKTHISDSKYPLNTANRYVTLQNFPYTPFTRRPSFPYILTTIGGSS